MAFKDLFSGGLSNVVSDIGGLADRFIQTPDDKAAHSLEIKKLIQARDSEIEQTVRSELCAKERILVAELQQGDSYTKRARPSVVYVGLAFIGINYVIFPMIGRIAMMFSVEGATVEPLSDLPTEFWAAWGGICTTWSIGRSAEKRGSSNKIVSAITGSSKSRLMD